MKTRLFQTGKAASLAVVAMAVVLALTSGAAYAATIVLHPTAQGNYNQWTLGAGTSKWSAANDEAGDASTGGPSADDGNTSYSVASTINWRDSYALADNAIVAGSTVTAITVHVLKSDNGSPQVGSVTPFYRVNSVDTDGTACATDEAAGVYLDCTLNATGLTWTVADLNTLEIGALAPDITPNQRITQVYVTVTYTPGCANEITTCSQCHAYAPLDSPTGIRNVTDGAIKGDHQVTDHVPASPTDADCNVCHTGVAGFDTKHRDSNITMAATIRGGTYSRGTSFAQSSNPTTGKCSNTQCHGIASPTWGVGSTDCSSCHPARGAGGAPVLAGRHSAHVNTTTAATDRTTYTNGSTGSTYRFTCGTCHDVDGQNPGDHLDLASTTGIKVDVIFNVTGVSTTWGGSYAGAGVTNAQASGSGMWYWTSGRTCQNVYCHSSVQATDGTSAPTYATPAWGDNVACGGCHNATGGTLTTGSHTLHVSTPTSYACAQCHENTYTPNNVKHVNGVIDMNLTNGTAASYSQGDNLPRGGYGSCTNVYCHGAWNTSGAVDNTPTWNVASTADCGDCHKATNAAPPTTGSHGRHAGQTAGQLNQICYNCHGTNGERGHQNAKVAWNLNSTFGFGATVPKYNSLQSGNTGAKARSLTYQTCSAVYCHSNAQNTTGTAGPTKYGTPTWGGAALTCAATSCHGSSNSDLTTGGHEAHINATYSTYNCSLCHYNLGDEKATHTDKSINLAFAGGLNAAGSYSQGMTHTPGSGGFGRCSTVTCHGEASPAWGSHRTATAGNAVCTTCHGVWNTASPTDAQIAPGGTGLDTGQDSAATDANVGAHQAHLTAGSSISAAIACNTCHQVPGTVTASGHIDNKLPADITFSGLALLNASNASYNYVNGDCSNVYCHNQAKFKRTRTNIAWFNAVDNTPRWNDTAYYTSGPADCDMCHGYPPKPSHSTSANCSSCHPNVDANDSSFSVIANRNKHVDGVVQVQMICDSCHGYPPRTGDPFDSPIYNAVNNEVGKGQHWSSAIDGAHILNSALDKNTDTYPGPAGQCGQCHPVSGTHENGTIEVELPASLTFSATGNADYIGISGDASPAAKAKAKTCSNVLCHFTTTPKWSCPQ